MKDSDYLSTGKEPGLLTILKRYEWTLTEHDDHQSDTALDPSLIGSVFERFIAIAENVKIGRDAKQPLGTYYTPKDITDEMVSDALAYALAARVKGIEYTDALELVHPKERDQYVLCKETSTRKQTIRKWLRELTVIDPCVGSGQFIVATLNALRRAERRLFKQSYDDRQRIEHAIREQLFAADIHPIAVQITRLRFYLALVAARMRTTSGVRELDPFPNLETRIVVADSLETKLHQNKNELGGLDPKSEDVEHWRAVRDGFMFAFTRIQKEKVRRRERKERKLLRIKADFASQDVRKWLDHDILDNIDVVAAISLPLLFGRKGWDIAIGNPPYQRLSADQKNKSAEYGYRTSTCNDLYTLFLELAIYLVVVRKGVVTMIVPHSICFAQNKQKLRDVCHGNVSQINIRTYNNRPNPIFRPHPFVKGGNQGAENRQRVSVLNLLTHTEDENVRTTINSSCYISIPKRLRYQVLAARPGYKQPSDSQWTTAGTRHLVNLLKCMRKADDEELPIRESNNTAVITFQPTAYHFITCLPKDLIVNPSRKCLIVPNDKYFHTRICLYNSRVFHAYWFMVDDAFHVNQSTFDNCKLPPEWSWNDELYKEAVKIGKKLCRPSTLRKCEYFFTQQGKTFPNYNFQENVPELIEQADRVCLRGYGLSRYEEMLLKQLEKVRKGQTWDL